MKKWELQPEEMERVAGGDTYGKIWKNVKMVKKEPCPNNNGKPHNYVPTGAEKEESYLVLWSKHMKEYKCSHCGKTLWVHED